MTSYLSTDPTLDKILKYADGHGMLPDGGLILACVSGGADSMAMLEILLEISAARNFDVAAAHFNHMLRGAESDRDEAFVRGACKERGIPLYCGSGDVGAHAKESGTGTEEAARELRYGFFYDAAALAGAARVATAHTSDDNAETVVMNLVRGAGAAGLSGIPPIRGEMVVRPMLCVSREEVMRFISVRDIPFVEDSTNTQDIYTRNRLRRSVMPVLRDMNPRLAETISTAAELARFDEDYLSEAADRFIADRCSASRSPRFGTAAGSPLRAPSSQPVAPNSVDASELLALPRAVSGRVIRKLFERASDGGGSLPYRQVEAVLGLCGNKNPSARLSLPDAAVYREYGRIVFGRADRAGGAAGPSRADGAGGAGGAGGAESFETVYLAEGEFMIGALGLKITCKKLACGDTINKSFTSFLFKRVDICGKIAVRPRREGDSIRLSGHNGTKSLKKLFIETRIPAGKRPLVPVIADECGVLAVYGIGIGSRALAAPGDPAVLIEFEETT